MCNCFHLAHISAHVAAPCCRKAVARLLEQCCPHTGHCSSPLHRMRLLGGWQQSTLTAAYTGSSDCLLIFMRVLQYRDERTAGIARRGHTRHHRQQRRPARAEHSADVSCRLACQVLDYSAHIGVWRFAEPRSTVPSTRCGVILFPLLCFCWPACQEHRASASQWLPKCTVAARVVQC